MKRIHNQYRIMMIYYQALTTIERRMTAKKRIRKRNRPKISSSTFFFLPFLLVHINKNRFILWSGVLVGAYAWYLWCALDGQHENLWGLIFSVQHEQQVKFRWINGFMLFNSIFFLHFLLFRSLFLRWRCQRREKVVVIHCIKKSVHSCNRAQVKWMKQFNVKNQFCFFFVWSVWTVKPYL